MPSDHVLIQIVDAALAEAARLAGSRLACRPGCAQCCMGPFPITPLDARRLRDGLAELGVRDPARAARVRERACQSAARLRRDYPGDTLARVLAEDEAGENEPCPALDPAAGTCDLYAARPITCRTFGPPLHFKGESPAVCELCFEGASDDEIAACEVEIDPDHLESALPGEVRRSVRNHHRVCAGAAAFHLMLQPMLGRCSAAHRAARQHRVNGRAQVRAGDGQRVFGAGAIELAAVDQAQAVVEEEEIRRAGGPVSLGHLLRFVVAIREFEAAFLSLAAHAVRAVIRVLRHVVGGDGGHAESLAHVFPADPPQFLLDVPHVGAVRANEHDQQAPLAGEAVERNGAAGHRVRQFERGRRRTQREHRRFRCSHTDTIA